MAHFTFTITEADTGLRADAFLARELPHYSRSFLATHCTIQSEEHTIKPSHRLKEHEHLTLIVPQLKELTILPEHIPLDILYEDTEILVIQKPAGQVVHPTDHGGHVTGTTVNALLWHLNGSPLTLNPHAPAHTPEQLRPGLVHRLDRDTSGVLVIAKTDQAKASLTKQFADRTTDKRYIALVLGHPPSPSGRIDAPIGRDHADRIRRTISTGADAKEAITEYTTLATLPGMALLSIHLLTGRTHQIRVHLASLQCPIAGDVLYGIPKLTERYGIPRLMLHAERISFRHPATHDLVTFTAPIPQEFQRYQA